MKSYPLLRPVKLKDGRQFPQGERFAVAFEKPIDGELRSNATFMVATREMTGETFKTRHFLNFFRAPSVATMEKWMDSGIARTVTGDKTEPDGYGPDGAPSWLLALGMI